MSSQVQLILHKVDQYINKRKFDDAINLILTYVEGESHDNHYKLYKRLANIYYTLKDYEKAYFQFEFMMNHCKTSSYIYYKLGFINHHHFSDYIKAHEMYEMCLSMKPDHKNCLFELAKLKFYELTQFDQAKSLFIKLITKTKQMACVWYHFGFLLHTLNHKKQMGFAFIKAIELQPNIAKYHFKFAICLEANKEYNKADYFYKKAIEALPNYDDTICMTYANFLDTCMDDKNGAKKYMQIAANMNHEYLHDYHKLQQSMMYQLEKKNKITLIIFDVNVIVNCGISEIYNINQKKMLNIFGGQDRIQKLMEHFQTNISIYNIQNIILLSLKQNQYYDVIYEMLNKVGLSQYTQLCKSNTSYFSNNDDCEIMNIIEIKDKFKLKYYDEVLFVSDSKNHIQILRNMCKVYFIDNDKSYPLTGIIMINISEIYQILNDEYHLDDNVSCNTTRSLSDINVRLLKDIIKQTKKKFTANKMITLINKIYEKMIQDPDYENFIKFHRCFNKALLAISNKQYWTAVQHFNEALQYDASQLDLHRGLAKCFSCLGYHEAANIAYNNAFTINPTHYYLNLSYGWHLLSIRQPQDALNHFEYTTKLSKHHNEEKNLLTAKAIACERIGDDEKAEAYYERATNLNKRIYANAHFNFGMFLQRLGRYAEAKSQLEIYVEVVPNKFIHKQSLMLALDTLNIQCKYNYSMDISIHINDYKNYILNKLNLNNNIVIIMGCSECEFMKRFMFDEFWFDIVNKHTLKFNNYYDTFIETGLNNVEMLMNDIDDIELMLTDLIAIDSIIDVKLIQLSLLKYKRHIYYHQYK